MQGSLDEKEIAIAQGLRKPAEKRTEQTWRVSEAGSSSGLQAVLLRTAGATAERHSVSHLEFLEEKVF